MAAAERIGYPVVVKLYSRTITHKTDVGGVHLNLSDAGEVRQAFDETRNAVTSKRGAEHFDGVTVQPMINYTGYELILGASTDPQLGPVLLFGAGGQLVEVIRDRSLGLPPLNSTLARRMIERTKISEAFNGVRGRRPIDTSALEELLVRFSLLVAEQRRVAEIDINPLLASPEQLVALDARIVLHPKVVADDDLPRLAIRPYPSRYVAPFEARDGSNFLIRPIRPEDEPLLVRFHEMLTADTVYARYLGYLGLSTRTAHERLTRVAFNDYDREIALVGVDNDETGQPRIVAVGRLSKSHAVPEAEFAILVADAWQGRGLGTELLNRLVQIGRDEKLEMIWAEMFVTNEHMRRSAVAAGFTILPPEGGTMRAELRL